MRNRPLNAKTLFTFQRATQAAAVFAAARTFYDTAEGAYTRYRERSSRTITVAGTVDFWPQLILDLTPYIKNDVRNHTVFVDYKRARTSSSSGVGFGPSLGTSFTLNLNGHRVEASLEADHASARSSGVVRRHTENRDLTASTLVFRTYTDAGEKAVRDLIVAARKNADLSETRVYTVSVYGNKATSRSPVRPPSSVVLAGNTMQDILDDLDDFINNEQYYISHGLPYHRGYMLEGPPGTGKTSLIEAVAVHTARSLYTLSLSSFPNDAELQEAMAGLPENIILAIEDIDTIRQASHKRENADKSNSTDAGVTLGGLLNALDGLGTPHGLITFMTTNKASTLDPALLRIGRTNVSLHLGYLDQAHFEKMWDFYGGTPGEAPELPHQFIPPALITECAKRARADKSVFEHLVRESLAPEATS